MTSAKTTTQDPPASIQIRCPRPAAATTRIRRYGAVILLPCSAACAPPEGVIGATVRGYWPGLVHRAGQPISTVQVSIRELRALASCSRRSTPTASTRYPRDELGLTGPAQHLAAWAAPVLLPARSAVVTGLDELPRPARSRWSWQGVTNLSASKVVFAW